MKSIKILGVKIDNLSQAELIAKIKLFITENKVHQIATVNPEFLLEARSNDSFLALLNRMDLNVADGFGLACGALVKGQLLNRHTGADLVLELLNLAQTEQWKIAIINRRDGLSNSQLIEKTIHQRWPSLKLLVVEAEIGDWSPELTAVKAFQADIVLCNLGAPFQEQLLSKVLPGLGAKLGIGIGGSLDYVTGTAKRAPSYLRAIGLEWLWRLVINPRHRLKRIIKAVIQFPVTFIIDDLIHPWLYRPNVVAFIYQRAQVLIVNSAKEERDYWKLPQGGRETWETAEEAVKREMMEELSLQQFQIKKIFPNIYQYKWPSQYSIRGYRGQRQTLCLIEYFGDKQAIKLDWENRDYRWVDIDELLDAVEPVTRPAYELFVKKYWEHITKSKEQETKNK